ncbi:DNA polymerase [Philodulcilactobacillus myokoensis]|uniref:DNA polymerase I n=1 Tax=Philodulcilactobacillus myokoensis TaxID=2929573 RepID=A0A9W6ES54_9LACO|nr:DNA polymerase I [Philodulcilactobacillus myokoensis]GLB46746.1 DNA polymerase [Philodulcilactobacillus myokoensis]
MAEKKQRLLLIDGNSIIYKAFFALPANRFTNDKGIHTNATYGFNRMLDTMLDIVKPTLALAAFDAGKITFRTKMYSDYKGGRKPTPDELIQQFPYVKRLLKARGIKSYQLNNYEADDIIGTLSKRAEKLGYETTIVTGDRDLTQLCSNLTTVSLSKTGVSSVEHFTTEHVIDKFGIKPSQIVDVKALRGDNSDNYPGVTLIGHKKAIKLIQKYGSMENVYQHLDDFSGKKMQQHLIEDKDKAYLAKKLATIDRQSPVTIKLSQVPYLGDQIDQLISFYKDVGFHSYLMQLNNSGKISSPKIKYTQLDSKHLKLIDHLNLDKPVTFYLAMPEPNYHLSPFAGFVIGQEDKWFVSKDIDLLNSNPIKHILESNQIFKNVFDAKRTYVGLNRLGIKLAHINFDMLLVSYLLNTNDNSNDLGKVAAKHGDFNIKSDEQVYGKGAKRSIPDDEILLKHLVSKAMAINNLQDQMFSQLKTNNQEKLYRQIELPVAFTLARMEIAGITVDTNVLNQMKNKYTERLSQVESDIYNQAGEKFNIGSPKQLGKILFEKLQLPVIKRTKTGYSTSVDVLEKLAGESKIVQNVLEYRKIAKILSTYIDGLLKVVHSTDHKVHTRYLQTLTQTGRLSSVDPNLQNIPVRTPEGKKIRKAFIPSHKGWEIFSFDYSQIELRVLAAISGDRNMQKEFAENDDIHASTARRIFNLKSNADVTPNLRRQAKAVNFGIVYGISAFGLSRNTGISRARAKSFIEKYFQEYPNVKKYMNGEVDKAHKLGYVETISHRRRYLPDIHSKNFHQRSFAERTAMNTPIQGSAADIIKIAMIKMERAIQNMSATMLLQIHDELIFEAPDSEIEELTKLVPKTMDSAVKLDVPLKVSVNYGKSWYDAK